MRSLFEELMYLYILEIYSFYNYKIRVLTDQREPVFLIWEIYGNM